MFRDTSSQQLMGVQFHGARWKQFEAYMFVGEKQQLDQLSREQVQQVLSGRCVVSVVIVPPCYTITTLRQKSLITIATLLLQNSDMLQERVASLGLPATLQQSLRVLLRHM